MRLLKRAGIAAVLAAAAVGIMSPAASAAPMPWGVHQHASAQGAAHSSAGETSTLRIQCGAPCYE